MDLTCVFFPDLLPWERDAVASVLKPLAARKSVQEISLSPTRPRLNPKQITGEPLWLVAKNWQQAVRWCRGYSGPVFLSVISSARQAMALPFLVFRGLRPALPRGIHLLAHSPLSHRFFLEIERVDANQVSLLPLAAAAASTPSSVSTSGSMMVGALGRFSSESGFNYFLTVAHYVNRINRDVRFRVLGAGGQFNHLMKMVRDLGLESAVEIVKGANSSDLRSIDLLVFSPIQNDHFIPVLMAGAAEIPVLSSELPGITDLIEDSKSGFIVPVNETKPMAELVLRMTSDLVLRKAMAGELNRRIHAEFSPAAIEPRYEQLFFGASAGRTLPAAAA